MIKLIGRVFKAAGLKRGGLKVYFFFINSWTATVKKSRMAIIPGIARRRSKKGIYAIDLDSDWLGLGARIIKTLEIFLYCDRRGLTPLVRYNYLEKAEADYFAELFGYKLADQAVVEMAHYLPIRDVDELGWGEDYNLLLTLDTAKPLFDKYLRFQPDILQEVDSFVQQHFAGQRILGLHYRGTDKAGEAPLLAREELLQHIKGVISAKAGFDKIFVSTDDEKIIHFLQQTDLGIPVICREDRVRSKDGDQFHRKKEVSKSTVHRDAIVNMLLLSRTSFLLKTASILSDCSIVFNPSIEVKVISFPHSERLTWWPATEIKKRQEHGTR